MDNVDKRCKARYMTMNNQNKDHHWCNAYAHRNRITAGMLHGKMHACINTVTVISSILIMHATLINYLVRESG